MEKIFEEFSGFHWDKGNVDKNLLKHNVENWRNNLIRIISARDMNKRERKFYDEK
jgi:uncharacterized DUF497 family protein